MKTAHAAGITPTVFWAITPWQLLQCLKSINPASDKDEKTVRKIDEKAIMERLKAYQKRLDSVKK